MSLFCTFQNGLADVVHDLARIINSLLCAVVQCLNVARTCPSIAAVFYLPLVMQYLSRDMSVSLSNILPFSCFTSL